MQKRNEKKQVKNSGGFAIKAFLGTLAIFAIGLLVFFAVDYVMPFKRGPMMVPIMQNMFLLSTLLSTLTLIFSLYLIYVYLKNYLELKNGLMFSLLLVVAAFMMFAMSANPIMQAIFGPASAFSIIPLVFAAVALGAMVWISDK